MGKSRILLLIGAICAAPLVLGTLVYYFRWDVGAPSNYGELLPLRELTEAPFLPRLHGKWVLVSFDAAACGDWCMKKLYYMRQLRRAQGKDMDRVVRVWMVTEGGSPSAELLQPFEGMEVFHPTRKLVRRFPGEPDDHIYLVDPNGNLMMRWPRYGDPSRMLKDLQRLMKVAG